MATAHLIRRRTARGVRWVVRFRWRRCDRYARDFATFERKRDAENCRLWVLGEMGQGRYPERAAFFADPVPSRTVADVHDAFAASRQDQVGASALAQYAQAKATYGPLADMDPLRVEVRHCQEWVRRQVADKRKPGTIGAYRSVLRQVLDFADLPHPNPARDPRVKLPRQRPELADPPSFAAFCAMRDAMTPRWVSVARVLERTGLRIGEGIALTPRDIDWESDLLRVRGTKTPAARRWVPLVAEARAIPEDLIPAGRRGADEPVWPGLSANAMRSAMSVACRKADVGDVFTPHDLRHRFTSLLVMAGVPAPLVRLILRHARIAVTFDTYSHVLLDEPRERLRELRDAAYTIPGVRPIEVGESPEAAEPSGSAVAQTSPKGGA